MGESEKAFEPKIVLLFKQLNQEKKKHKSRKSLLEAITKLSKYLGIPKNQELFLLELYLLNFRQDGDYSSLTKENFVDPRYERGKRTTNQLSNMYTSAQLPFKGSNLEGYWDTDRKGVEQYIVNSYGYYPIYIYKEGKWYENTKRYSVSTGKQMRYSDPVEYDDDLNSNVFYLTPEEMYMIKSGYSHDQIMKKKLEKIKEKEPELKSKRLSSQKTYYPSNLSIKYKIDSVDVEGDTAIVNVDIYDVLKKVGNTTIATPENYLKGELENVTPEMVESTLENSLKFKFKDYVGPRTFWSDRLSPEHKIKFNFRHLKK